ncbi:MAG: PilZ domain-containing protein [Terriglobia bacterium]
MPEKQKIDWAERRTSRRLTVSLPLLVRGRDVHGHGFEDTTSSYNVSREGASFLTTRELALGQQVALIIPRRPLGREGGGRADFETTGEVRRVIPKGEAQWEVGVHFTGPRLRTYMPESA